MSEPQSRQSAGGPPAPAVLTSKVATSGILKMMIPLGVLLFIATWMVVMLVLGPMHVPMAKLVAVVIAAVFVAVMFVVKRKQLEGQQTGTTLELTPEGMRRTDPLVVVEIPWARVSGFTVGNTMAKAVVRGPRVGSLATSLGAGATAAAADRKRTEVSIMGGGTIRRLPGLGSLAGTQVEQNYSLYDELPQERDRLIVTPGHFESEWRSGQIAAHLRYHRPDLVIPATDEEVEAV